MTAPSIDSRLRRRVLLMSADAGVGHALRARLAPGWEMIEALDIDAVGGFADVLQLRFVLIDLDTGDARGAIDAIARIRTELMVNVPIFCFGGDAAARGEARMSGADRLFERDTLVERLPEFCVQFGW